MSVACSCGVPGCPELGWPHTWDPVAAGDECMAVEPFGVTAFCLGDADPRDIVLDAVGDTGALNGVRHRVREPHIKYGSGYACRACAGALA